jgi:phage tail sheath protein FI
MPSALTYPGVYIEEVSSGVRTIAGVATSIALFVGWSGRGPIDRAVRISSFSDYQRTYGPLDKRSMLGYSVMQFFANGGADAYVLRLADSAAKPSKASFGTVLDVEASSPGAWGDGYAVRITPRASDPTRFKIEVLDKKNSNAVVESFENLSIDKTDPRYVMNVINGEGRSAFIHITATGATPPAATSTKDLTAGVEGAPLSPGTSGFHTKLTEQFGVGSITDRIDIFNLLCVPGETDAATLGALQAAAKARRAFLIADAPSDAKVASLNSGLDAALTSIDVPNAAFFFPWVKAPDPLQDGALAEYPPSGFVAGVFARTDSTRGVWKAPAGSEAALVGASGLSTQMSDAENGQLNPLGINCLRHLPVYGNVVWGARTVHGQTDRGSEWKYVPVRRMALYLEESLYRGTQWVVFEPNDEPLWAQIRLNIGAFLQGLFRQGAFQGRTPREAYFVKCDRETTTQADINLGIVNILVGFAPLKPAEFVVLRLQQIAGDIPT